MVGIRGKHLVSQYKIFKVSDAVLICETFRLKRVCKLSPKFARSDAVHRRGNRWTDGDRCHGTTLCVARKWVPRRARGEESARPPLRQHPTPPRRRRRPRPHSRYQRGACRGALGRCVMGTCCTAYGLSRGARARRRGAHVSYSGRSAGFDHRRGITGG